MKYFNIFIRAGGGRGGGGGHGSSGGHSSFHSYSHSYSHSSGGLSASVETSFYIFLVCILVFLAIFYLFMVSDCYNKDLEKEDEKDREKRLREDSQQALAQLQRAGCDWELLQNHFTQCFLTLQKCWQERDYSNAYHFLMPYILHLHHGELERLMRLHQINKMEDVEVEEILPVKIGKNQSSITVLFKAKARDYFIDDRDGVFLFGDFQAEPFQEFWTFEKRIGGINEKENWLLSRIDQYPK